MNPAPGTSWPDLHYTETEQVDLDVSAIIARGTRLRRRRLITKVTAAVVVVGIAPAAIVVGVTRSTPDLRSEPRGYAAPVVPAAGSGTSGTFGTDENGPEHGPEKAAGTADHASAGTAGNALMFSLRPAVVRHATTLSRRYGPLLAVAGARAGSGLWFTATAGQLSLFHLSMTHALKAWLLPAAASSVRASGGTGLAVTTASVAWIGVGSTLLRLDTRNSKLSSWQLPPAAGDEATYGTAARASMPDSVAVSPDGHVAVATSQSDTVQVLDPRRGTFRQIRLPSDVDRPLAVGYARNGTLGIGYEHPGRPHADGLLLVQGTGAERSVHVPQPTAVAAYGASGLLVGVTRLRVVPSSSHPRPLVLPADSPDFTSVTNPPVPLMDGRLGIAMNGAVLTFPAMTYSNAVATGQSQLWVTPPPRCQPHVGCPAGYRLLATDSDGNLWVVPRAHPDTVELVSLQ